MPGNIAAPNPVGVFPKVRYSSIDEGRVYPVLVSPFYKDGSTDRSVIEDGVNIPVSIRAYTLGIRDTPAVIAAIRTFLESTVLLGTEAFYWYHPYEVLPGTEEGTNYDATGITIVGRHVVCVRGDDWTETMSNPSRGDYQLVFQDIYP